ncbi:retinal homeobox protein Rx-B-like [Zeugodacus cucurbitae]|uniref:retinal homeobox protein Rx-B-like n=1 Tax=Zeugodacus cucurbitae TaxID=28588 RepID=UPI0023D9644F|nr:retinal homeobox protein Rx-B-like [Zeugodacus cucurbitae]
MQSVNNFSHDKIKDNRIRTVYTYQQIYALEAEYTANKFAKGARRKQIAQRIGMQEIQVRTWFKNRRAREKNENFKTTTTSAPIEQSTVPAYQHTSLKRSRTDDLNSFKANNLNQSNWILPPPACQHSSTIENEIMGFTENDLNRSNWIQSSPAYQHSSTTENDIMGFTANDLNHWIQPPSAYQHTPTTNDLNVFEHISTDDYNYIMEFIGNNPSDCIQPPPAKKPKIQTLEQLVLHPDTNCWIRI